ncbi:MAG: putative Ig domain-containing protein [Alistipes sp.]|nr:putative Ig domain-containing protein [Alistipes sp.]MBQ5692420.1 putative Ig domain-containing protein [Alistipes sp.]
MRKLIILAAAAALFFQPTTAQEQQVEIPDLSAYILTPKPARTPRINGAKVFGLRPGSKCLYNIAATGDRPMTFSIDKLPKGLKLNAETGQITGSVKKEGTYRMMVTATNALGSYTRELRIVVGDKLALTPPMGWNSWNCWARDVTQEQVLSSARAMVSSGLVNHGWTYINIDDGWQGKRGGKWNAIQPNEKFPDMKALTREVHDMGLKLGIYSVPWVGTYAAHIGSYSDNPDGVNQWIKDGLHNENYRYQKPNGDYWKDRKEFYLHGKYSFVEADVKQWEEWEIDYLKYDWNPNTRFHTKEMFDALRKLDRDIILSLSNSAPLADAPFFMEHSECWRTTGDIRDTWKSISSIGFSQDKWIPFCAPGAWPDADMLVVGLVGWGPKLHYTKLTPDEQYTHMSLWALFASPLLIGCDMARLDDFTLSLLTNDEVIEVNQDPLGYHAVPVWRKSDNSQVIYVKHLEDGSLAVGMFNRGNKPANISINPRMLGLYDGNRTVRDLWRQKDVGTLTDDPGKGRYTALVPAHGVVLVKVYPGNSDKQYTGKVTYAK